MHLNAISNEEVESIHKASLRILSEIGVVLNQPEAVEILTGAGGIVRKKRVIFPPDMVERKLANCPRQVKLRGRGGNLSSWGTGA